ncbi:hypothetical protein [Mammaliicoccus sciuri]|uniref:hypothetical protein n=1 Tax=Mammaliicoccus sciuri TaxID=1296 RepID=UPI002DBEDEAF|nr:hypothetical protein [Mammaliicoccus sciuri]MEB6231416.1 DUF1024 family protein [Mammaliicoccus sciuri]
MAYEYEEAIKSSVEMELFRHGHHLPEYDTEVIKELKEVYAKAKAFDEIKKLEKETILYSIAGKEDVELGAETRKIINKYMEDK